MLRPTRCRCTEVRRPPRFCTASCGGGHKHADRSRRSTAVGTADVTPLLVRPALALPVAARGLRLNNLGSHQAGEGCTQSIDRRFEGVIPHIARHDHPAGHPLAPASQFPLVELGHGAVALEQGVEQGHHGIDTDAVTLCECGDVLLSLRSQVWHTAPPRRGGNGWGVAPGLLGHLRSPYLCRYGHLAAWPLQGGWPTTHRPRRGPR